MSRRRPEINLFCAAHVQLAHLSIRSHLHFVFVLASMAGEGSKQRESGVRERTPAF